jgi:exodeoxyribonuclease-5
MGTATKGQRFTLIAAQREAVEGILRDIATPGARVVLCGYAGTGKTVTTAALVQEMVQAGLRVAVATPTHKARAQVERALRNCGAEKFETVTIHRLLGLKQVRDKNTGKETFAPDSHGKNMLSEVREWNDDKGCYEDRKPIDVVIVDETSMVGADLYGLLLSELGDRPVVFVGDDRQLLPVGEKSVCRAFVDAKSLYRLKEVLRHDGAILNLATATRELSIGRAVFADAVGGGSRVVAHRRRDEWLESLLSMAASDEAMADSDYCRVLAWTNRDVNDLNQRIHFRRYGEDAPQFVVGMTCVTVDTIASPEGGQPLLNSTVDVMIEEIEQELFEAPGDEAADPGWQTWMLQVSTPESVGLTPVRVLDGGEERRWNAKQKEIADRAKAAESREERGQLWETYFKRKDQIGRLQPASALTIHKSQGSTFRHVFLHWSIDGYGSTPTAIQNQLAYVGITRAAESLHVIADRLRGGSGR